MISVVDKLKKIRDCLVEVHKDVFHYEAKEKTNRYIVWQEDSEGNSLSVDNEKKEQVISGTIDLFTKEEYDPLIDTIQKGLNDKKISFKLMAIQYEEETQYIHYEWRFEV